jgi:hypothetical protein
MSALPIARVSITCGACGSELEHDGDNHQCYECKLQYPSNPFEETPAEFFDEEDEPCGHEPRERESSFTRPFQTVNGVVTQYGDYRTVHGDCTLPKGHPSQFHYHSETTTRELRVA